ncbi:MAG: hypothetical protein AAF401_13975, partial [Pseudomonadota bacterium]
VLLHTQQQRKRHVNYVLHTQAASRKIGMEDPTGLAALAAARSAMVVDKGSGTTAADGCVQIRFPCELPTDSKQG